VKSKQRQSVLKAIAHDSALTLGLLVWYGIGIPLIVLGLAMIVIFMMTKS